MLIALIVIVWLALGVLGEGLSLGYFTREFPWSKNSYWSFLLALAGPVDLVATLLFLRGKGPYVFRLRPLNEDERWEYFREEWPILSKSYFRKNM